MRQLILLGCFLFTFLTFYSPVSFGDFSYDIDRFTQVGGASGYSTFVDEFNDGAEPPSGPSGPSTYGPASPFSPDSESGGFLNLNSNDVGGIFPGDDECVGAVLSDSAFFFNPGSGGKLEGKFRFTDGIAMNTGFDAAIMTLGADGVADSAEDVYLSIEKRHSGSIVALFDSVVNGIETTISEIDISNFLTGITDITLRLVIDTANVVTASLDIGSNGSFDDVEDVAMPGSHTLTFIPGESYTGFFEAFFEGPVSDIQMNQTIYTAGDTVTATVWRLANLGANPVSVEWKVWLMIPSIPPISIINLGADETLVLPGGFDLNFGPLDLFPAAELPPGNYEFSARLLDPVTGELLCEDVNPFQIQ